MSAVPAPSAKRNPSEEELQATRLGWIGLAVVCAMSLLFLIWSIAAPLAATAVTQGVVKTDRNRRVVQHQEGGMVRQILVRDGDRVQAGQELVLLDDPVVRAELRKVDAMLESELAKLARLDAEHNLARKLVWPAELDPRRREPGIAAVLEREAHVFRVRRGTLDAQVALVHASIREVEHEIDALESQKQESEVAAAKMREELSTNEALLSQGFVQKTRVTALQRAASEYGMKRGEAMAELAKARQKKAELEFRMQTLTADFMQSASAELKQTTDRIEQLRAQLEPSADAASRQSIRAPVNGRVVDLKLNTVGEVVAPRETIMEIVPDDAPLVIEGRLRTDAIADVQRGTQAGVRLLAFDQRSMPVLSGKVVYLSADRQIDRASNEIYYTVQVEVDEEALRAVGVGELMPGMPAELYLRARERSALSYLIDPFTRRLQRAMRDK